MAYMIYLFLGTPRKPEIDYYAIPCFFCQGLICHPVQGIYMQWDDPQLE